MVTGGQPGSPGKNVPVDFVKKLFLAQWSGPPLVQIFCYDPVANIVGRGFETSNLTECKS